MVPSISNNNLLINQQSFQLNNHLLSSPLTLFDSLLR